MVLPQARQDCFCCLLKVNILQINNLISLIERTVLPCLAFSDENNFLKVKLEGEKKVDGCFFFFLKKIF